MTAKSPITPNPYEALFWAIPLILTLVAAITSQPNVFYLFLRVMVDLGAVFAARACLRQKIPFYAAWILTFVILFVLYNPIIPFHFDRSTWVIWNISTAAIFLINVGIVFERHLK